MTEPRRSTPGAAGNVPAPGVAGPGVGTAGGDVAEGEGALEGVGGEGVPATGPARGPVPGARRWVVDHGSAVFAMAVALASVGYFIQALHYQRGTSAQPGPGLFPQAVAIAIFVTAVGTAVTTWRTRPVDAAEGEEHHPFRPVAVVIGAVLFVSTIHTVGFFFAAAMALIVVEVGMGVRNPFRVALYSLLLAFVAQLLFVDVLGLTFFSKVHFLSLASLPTGPLP